MRARYGVLILVAACNLRYPDDVTVDANRDAALADGGFADAAPGTIAIDVNGRSFVRRSGSVSIPITISRGAGVDSDVAITVTSPPSGVQFDALTIPAGQSSGQLVAHADAAAPYARATSTVHAAAGSATAMHALDLDVIGSPGAVDTSFGTSGTVQVGDALATGTAIFAQTDRLVAVQIARPSGKSGVQLARLDADGAADTTFGTNGVYYDELTSTGLTGFTTLAATTRPDGRFFLAGSGSTGGVQYPFVVGLTADGASDSSTPAVNLGYASVRIRAVMAFDVDYVLAGWKAPTETTADAYLRGSTSAVLPEVIDTATATQEFVSLFGQSFGRVVAVEYDTNASSWSAVRRYRSDGNDDSGIFKPAFGDSYSKPFVQGAAPDPRGFIAWGNGGGPLATGVHTVLAVWRCIGDGSADTFGPTPALGYYESPQTTRGQNGVTVLSDPSDGGYLVIGYDVDVSTTVGQDYVMELVKLDASGNPDMSIGTQGVVRDTAVVFQPIAAATRSDHRIGVLGIQDPSGVHKLVVRAYFY
jgi:hypothetical protein